MSVTLQAADWLGLFTHYLILSLISIGGAITTLPEMHRYLVDEHGWLSDPQFNASIAIAQAAPGPNVLFVALLGWNVGINSAGGAAAGMAAWGAGLAGLLITMTGIMLPSATLTYVAGRWNHRNRNLPGVRAFKQGLAPSVVALLVATGWIMAVGSAPKVQDWPLWLVAGVSALIVWRTRLHLLWLLGAGALLGWLGLV
ncbi:MAG: chromate transporter [Burkholderiaceae bacterium]|nr:chromate transporter [Burkholderiaceae bacterium]